MHVDSLMAYLGRSFEHAAKVVCRKTAKKTKPGLIHAKGAPFLGPPWSWLFLSVPPQGWCRSNEFIRTFGPIYLVVLAVLWGRAHPEYFGATDGFESPICQWRSTILCLGSAPPAPRPAHRWDPTSPVHAQIPGIAPSDAAGSAQLATGRRQKYPARGWRQRNPGGGVAVSVGTAMDVTGCRRAGFPSHRLASTAAATIA